MAGHRMTASSIDVPGLGPVLAIALYLRVGEGLSKANLQLLADVAVLIEEVGGDFIVGGDFNMGPEVLRKSVALS